MICYVHILIINISLLASLLQAMEPTASNIQTKKQEEIEVATLMHNARYYTPEIHHVKGLLSAIYPMNEHTIGIVASDTAGAQFSTLHVYNMNKNSWNTRIISGEERRLAECGFDIEAMDTAKQTFVANRLKHLNIWNSKVPPITTQTGQKIFVDIYNRIVTLDSQTLKLLNRFVLPDYIPPYKEMCLYPSNVDHIILSTHTIDNGIVHVFLPDGTHYFSDAPDEDAGKPERVIEGHNTIAIGREHSTAIYTYDSEILQPKPLYCYKGQLIDWYNDKAIISKEGRFGLKLFNPHLHIVQPDGNSKTIVTSSNKELQTKIYPLLAFKLDNGFFGTIHNQTLNTFKLKVFDSYMHCIQKRILSQDYTTFINKLLISYKNNQQNICLPINSTIPLLHTAINKIVPSATGYPMFSVQKGLLMFLNPNQYTFDIKPKTKEEFHFLVRQDKAPYILYKTIASGDHNTIHLNELITYFRIPDRLRKKLIETAAINSYLNFHTMVLTEEEKAYIKDAHSEPSRNILEKITYVYDANDCNYYYDRYRQKEEYEEIPKRFQNIIDHYYKNKKNDKDCIIL